MSLSLSSIVCKPCPNSKTSSRASTFLHPITRGRARARAQAGGRGRARGFACKCELNEQSLSSDSTRKDALKLGIGTPVIIVEAPKMIKTAASVPCLRLNAGLVNPGDVGRIVTRKPMDVWAVRLNIGTYLIDRKYFKPLELDE